MQTAEFEWDFGAAYRQCAQLSRRFKTYNWACHNCRTFSREFRDMLKKNGADEQKNITGEWPRTKLLELARQEKVPFHMTDDEHIKDLFAHSSSFWVIRRLLDKGVNIVPG